MVNNSCNRLSTLFNNVKFFRWIVFCSNLKRTNFFKRNLQTLLLFCFKAAYKLDKNQSSLFQNWTLKKRFQTECSSHKKINEFRKWKEDQSFQQLPFAGETGGKGVREPAFSLFSVLSNTLSETRANKSSSSSSVNILILKNQINLKNIKISINVNV